MVEDSNGSFRDFASEEKISDDILKKVEMLACFIGEDKYRHNNPTLSLSFLFLGVNGFFFWMDGTK